jgi:hypothetical protein
MPSRRPILTDIHDLKLDPNHSHHSTERNGRLTKPAEEKKVEEASKALKPVLNTTKSEVTLSKSEVSPESEQPLMEIVDNLIDVKQKSVELLDLEQETLSDIKNASTFLPEKTELKLDELKKTEEKIEQSQEKKKKFVKNVEPNTNS